MARILLVLLQVTVITCSLTIFLSVPNLAAKPGKNGKCTDCHDREIYGKNKDCLICHPGCSP